MTNTEMNLLQLAESMHNVDVDSHDPAESLKVAAVLGRKPHDQTSNPAWLYFASIAPENEAVVKEVVREYGHLGWEKMHHRLAAVYSKANIGNIQGRVLAQVSPKHVDSFDATLAAARSLAEEFEKVGIPRSRYCIKIMIGGPSAAACKVLNDEGIRTLGTTVFGVPQALASSQAGCLYISPYYNDSRHHSDIPSWPAWEDPALQHDMSPRLYQIRHLYSKLYQETGREQPLIKVGGFIGPREVIAVAELGCHSSTIIPRVLGELAATKSTAPIPGFRKMGDTYKDAPPPQPRLAKHLTTDPFIPEWDGILPDLSIDWLVDNGVNLDLAIASDPIASARLALSRERFGMVEDKLTEHLDSVAKGLSA